MPRMCYGELKPIELVAIKKIAYYYNLNMPTSSILVKIFTYIHPFSFYNLTVELRVIIDIEAVGPNSK